MLEHNAVTFRRATLDDVPDLADFRWRFQTDDAEVFDTGDRSMFIDAFMKSVTESFWDGSFVHWIAETDGKIVAVMSIGRVRKVPSPKAIDRSMVTLSAPSLKAVFNAFSNESIETLFASLVVGNMSLFIRANAALAAVGQL